MFAIAGGIILALLFIALLPWIVAAVLIGALLLWFSTTSAGQYVPPDGTPAVLALIAYTALGVYAYKQRRARKNAPPAVPRRPVDYSDYE